MWEALQARRVAGHTRDFARPPLDDSDDSSVDRELAYTNEDIPPVMALPEAVS